MLQYLPDDCGVFDTSNHLRATTAGPAGLNVNVEHPFQSLSPCHRDMAFCGRFLIRICCNFPGTPASPGWRHPHPVFAVRRKDTMESCQVHSGPGYQSGQFGDKVHRFEDDVSRAITIRGFQFIANLALFRPPYNTGSAFTHYDDGLEHSLWLSMMRDRLEIIRNLMADDGSLWITIDDNEAHYLKVLCDEVFGRSNFVSTVTWQKKYAPKSDSKFLSESHDFVIVYAKTKGNLTINRLAKGEKQISRYKNPDNDPRGRWKPGDTLRNEVREYAVFSVKLPSGKEAWPSDGTSWRYTKEKFRELIEDNRIWFGRTGKSRPAIKRFLAEVVSTMPAQTIWLHTGDAGNKMNPAAEHIQPFNEICVHSIFLITRERYWSAVSLHPVQPMPESAAIGPQPQRLFPGVACRVCPASRWDRSTAPAFHPTRPVFAANARNDGALVTTR